MIPGLTTKLSESSIGLETTIKPLSDLVRVTSTSSTTVLASIVPPFGGFSGITIVLNESGANITTVTSGNIKTAVTIGQNVAVMMVYSKVADKYYVGALA